MREDERERERERERVRIVTENGKNPFAGSKSSFRLAPLIRDIVDV
jgi:hypothetical protein